MGIMPGVFIHRDVMIFVIQARRFLMHRALIGKQRCEQAACATHATSQLIRWCSRLKQRVGVSLARARASRRVSTEFRHFPRLSHILTHVVCTYGAGCTHGTTATMIARHEERGLLRQGEVALQPRHVRSCFAQNTRSSFFSPRTLLS
jgi:hypothetical protein